jgi:hypothetical protein
MKPADRKWKHRSIIAFAILVTIIAMIAFIGSLVFLEPIARNAQELRYFGIKTILINLRHCVWVGLIVSAIVGWRYAQAKLSGCVTVGILSLVAIVEMVYLLYTLFVVGIQAYANALIGNGY